MSITIKKHNVTIRLVQDLRIDKKSSNFDPENPKYPVKIGIYWDGCPRERVVGELLPKKMFYSTFEFKANLEHLVKKDLRPFQNTLIQYADVIDKMDTWNFNDFKILLKRTGREQTVGTMEFYFNHVQKKTGQERYMTAKNSLLKFNGNLPSFEECDAAFIRRWEHWFLNQTNSKGEILKRSLESFGTYATNLSTIFRAAIDDDVLSEGQYPFGKTKGIKDKYEIKTGIRKKFIMPLHLFQEISDAKIEDERKQYHRDLFIMSFSCAGMNLIDLLQLTWADYDQIRGQLSWKRHKTKDDLKAPLISCPVTDQVKDIIVKYSEKGGADDFIFPELKGYSNQDRRDSRKADVCKAMNTTLREIVKEIGYSEWDKCTYGVARKSWATHAIDQGFTIEHVGKFFGHRNTKTTEGYVGAIPKQTMDKYKEMFSKIMQ